MSRRRDLWDVLLDWRVIPPLFILFTLIMSVLANALFDVLTSDPASGPPRSQFVLIITGGLVLALVVGYALIAWLRSVVRSQTARPRSIDVGQDEAFTVPRAGIVYTLGGQTATLDYSFKNQMPQRVGLVCAEEPELRGIAEAWAAKCGLAPGGVRVWPVSNVANVQASADGAEALARWMLNDLGLPASDVVIDVTGGKKTMSIGAFLAADKLGLDTQYVSSDFDAKNVPIPGTQEEVLVRRHA